MYEYQHVPIVGAVNEVCPMGFPGGMTFSFWEDKVRRQCSRTNALEGKQHALIQVCWRP